MTHTQHPAVAAQPAPFLTERENQRAVDIIEQAERSAPFCHCGRHMLAIAEDDKVWLECSGLTQEKSGLGGLLARVTAFSHTRHMIMELPSAH